MYYHFRKNWVPYLALRNKSQSGTTCPFCDPDEITSRIIRETDHVYVMANKLFYDQWELRRVTDHLLLVPKKHITHLQELDADARAEIINIMAEYESEHYEIYARSFKNVQRSVDHQHTHLIKTEMERGRGVFFWNKPYILWLFR